MTIKITRRKEYPEPYIVEGKMEVIVEKGANVFGDSYLQLWSGFPTYDKCEIADEDCFLIYKKLEGKYRATMGRYAINLMDWQIATWNRHFRAAYIAICRDIGNDEVMVGHVTPYVLSKPGTRAIKTQMRQLEGRVKGFDW